MMNADYKMQSNDNIFMKIMIDDEYDQLVKLFVRAQQPRRRSLLGSFSKSTLAGLSHSMSSCEESDVINVLLEKS